MNVEAQPIACLGLAALGLLCAGQAQAPPPRLPAADGLPKLAFWLAVAFLCSDAGQGARNWAVANFLEPARIGLDLAVSKLESED
jgi:hypothetical protein